MAHFKVGDVVRLKSGSPEMTITSYSPNKVDCIYHSKDKDDFVKISVDFQCLILSDSTEFSNSVKTK